MVTTNAKKGSVFISIINNNDEQIVKFNATITYCKYYNEDSSWGVFGFVTEDDIPDYVTQTKEDIPFVDKQENKKEQKFSTLAGRMQELTIGGEYMIKARYKFNKTYGHQYEPISVYALIPQTKDGQLLFLQSIISSSLAENLLNAYPNIVNDVVNGSIQTIDYSLVKGIREHTWSVIKEKILNNYLISDIITMLKPLGVTYTMIKKLLDYEPNPSLLKKQLEENPYMLTVIPSLGFKRIDELALKVKPELLCTVERLVAFIQYYFTEMGENEGHTWCSVDILKNAISNNVPDCADKIDWVLDNNEFLHFSKEKDKVGLQRYYEVEMKIYNLLLHKSKIQPEFQLTDAQVNKAINDSEKEQGFIYSDEQNNVIKKTVASTVSLISGKAGVGKSSILRAIIKAYIQNNKNVIASALSAMAAKRITEATGFSAATIHRTLGCQGLNKFLHNKDNPLITDVAFLDEGSMVNANLFLKWLEAIGDKTHIIICGDHKQLPPIGYGNVFSDLIEMFDNNVSHQLTKPMRQAQMSGILSDANLIRDNINPIKEQIQTKLIHGELKDMYYMFRNNRQSLSNIAINTYLKSVEEEGIDNVAIIVPRRQGCANSTNELNKIIQEKLLGHEKCEIVGYEMTFKLGAKVMQTVNDYSKNVFNGDIGYITKIDKEKRNNKIVEYCEINFKDIITGENKVLKYTKKELATINLAYALTTHKCQGSGINTVIGIIDYTHYQLLDNCMLYTLLTRAKKRCLLLAEPDAFMHCIRTSHNRRNTWMSME